MKRWFLLVVLLLAGCGVPQPPPSAGDVQVGPTAFIAESYPTAEAQNVSPKQAASGMDVQVTRAWQDGKQVNADVCFSVPDSSDWSVWNATLQYGDTILSEFGTTILSLNPPADGLPGQRCDTLNFYVPPDAVLTNVTITVDSLAALPREGEYCNVYMPKIQQTMQERGIAITLECAQTSGQEMMQIMSFPPEMTKEQAEAIVYSDEFFTVKGPWAFTFSLTP
jgi:hypothetical protein